MKPLLGTMIVLSMLGSLTFGACAGESDEDKVRHVAELVAARSPDRCDYMTEEFIRGGYRTAERCRKTTTDRKPGVVERVAVNGEVARATVNFQGFHSKLELAKSGGDWKIQGVDYAVDPDSEQAKRAEQRESKEAQRKAVKEAAEAAAKPIETGLNAVDTVKTYYQAIRDGDSAGFCALLSRRHAIRILGKRSDTPIVDCVMGLQGYDWSTTRKLARGVKPIEAGRSGEVTIVTLTRGKRAVLKTERRHLVIDDIQQSS